MAHCYDRLQVGQHKECLELMPCSHGAPVCTPLHCGHTQGHRDRHPEGVPGPERVRVRHAVRQLPGPRCHRVCADAGHPASAAVPALRPIYKLRARAPTAQHSIVNMQRSALLPLMSYGEEGVPSLADAPCSLWSQQTCESTLAAGLPCFFGSCVACPVLLLPLAVTTVRPEACCLAGRYHTSRWSRIPSLMPST